MAQYHWESNRKENTYLKPPAAMVLNPNPVSAMIVTLPKPALFKFLRFCVRAYTLGRDLVIYLKPSQKASLLKLYKETRSSK